MTASEMSVLAHRLESLAGRGRWVSIGSIDSHRSMQLNRCDLDDLRVAAGALREAGRPRGAAFENTERDRLAWRDRAWKAESELDAALAEVERLREGIREHKHDALCNGPLFAKERIEALWALLDTPADQDHGIRGGLTRNQRNGLRGQR